MLVGLRIISILYDLFLASMLFYRPLSKINMKKKSLVALFFILIFHGELVFLFSESRIFLVSNLLLNILEYYLIGLNFDYPIRQSSFWILLQTSLSLLAGAVLNQGIQLILPLGELSKNLEAISLYLGISFSYPIKGFVLLLLRETGFISLSCLFYLFSLLLQYLPFKEGYLEQITCQSFLSHLSLY